MASPRSKRRMLHEYRNQQITPPPPHDSEEKLEVHAELLYEEEDKDYRSREFEKKWDEEKKNVMKQKAFFIFLISAVTVLILAILWFVIGEALSIGFLIVITVILTGAVVWVLKRYYIDPLQIDYKQYIDPWK